jgi:cell division protein FtsB
MEMDAEFDLSPPQSATLSPLWRLIPQILTGAIFFVVVCIMLTAFRPQMIERAQLDNEIERLQLLKKQAEFKKARKEEQLAWLKVDLEYMEIQARDLLGVSLPGETVVKFNSDNERVH